MGSRHHATRVTLSQAHEICAEYAAADMTLTLRQLYYQFVSRGYCGNGHKQYKRLGQILANARLSGEFPLHWLEDRGRTVHPGAFYTNKDDVHEALGAAAQGIHEAPFRHLHRSRWLDQETFVSVWVEKDALAGVFEPVCNELGVSWLACKGYPSISALHKFTNYAQWLYQNSATQRGIVLYFGDHDPDGWEIPRSAQRNVGTLLRLKGCPMPFAFQRIALNMDQIEQFDPPPFPAKVSSARYEGYVEEHGTDDAWELDALEPLTLRQLVRDEVAEWFDASLHDANQATINELREQMREQMREPEWMARAIGGM